MPTDHKIDYLELPGGDFAAIQAFYSSTFGWKFTDYGPEYTAFTDDKLNGGFYKSKLQSKQSAGAALIVLFAADLEGTETKVKASGGTICREIFSFPGGRRFHFLDPHGNELAVWSDK
ncbi:MAG: VOC family protein [Pirellulales bacterium]